MKKNGSYELANFNLIVKFNESVENADLNE